MGEGEIKLSHDFDVKDWLQFLFKNTDIFEFKKNEEIEGKTIIKVSNIADLKKIEKDIIVFSTESCDKYYKPEFINTLCQRFKWKYRDMT